jgi:hypothetical protein
MRNFLSSLNMKEIVAEAEKQIRPSRRGFKSDVDLLEAARVLFELHTLAGQTDDDSQQTRLGALELQVRARLERGLRMASGELHVVRAIREHSLTPVETDLLLLLTLAGLGLVRVETGRISDIDDVQLAMRGRGERGIAIVGALQEDATLARAGLIEMEPDEVLTHSRVAISSEFLAPLLSGGQDPAKEAWQVATQDELLDRCYPLVGLLRERSEVIQRMGCGSSRGDLALCNSRIRRMVGLLRRSMVSHEAWPAVAFLSGLATSEELLIALLLIGKELGFVGVDDDVFLGEGLARAVSLRPTSVRHHLSLLAEGGRLRRERVVQVSGGLGQHVAQEDESTLRYFEFELTAESLSRIGLQRRRKQRMSARAPLVTFDQLVLPGTVMRHLDLALAQHRHRDVLLEDWGLAKATGYGHGTTVLFHGPPGVGKTATAEAMAHALGTSILVVNYAEVQNMFVGQTEKNIVRIFRQAEDDGALLFWDEADAMFFDRNSATQNWEVRDVNVLLQEIERFRGVCILSTNRVTSFKIEFTAPDRSERRRIWERMLPAALPLAPDVDLDLLAEPDLTGGEIKNVLMNAARSAVARDPTGSVTLQDFVEATTTEQSGHWRKQPRVGFGDVG